MLNKFTQTIQQMIGVTPEWLAPISEEQPCGPNLEYDAEYMLLMAKVEPKTEVQYGDFMSAPEAINWVDIERDCRRLLLRSRDINLLALLLRCRIRSAQSAGLVEGLTLLVGFLEHYPEHMHPQLLIDGHLDPAMRANALAALIDPEGLMADIREIVLVKNSAMRLQIRDVERAFAVPRLADALPAEAVQRQLADLRSHRDPVLKELSEAHALVEKLLHWCEDKLPDDAPDLHPLSRLLGLLATKSTSAPALEVVKSDSHTNNVTHHAPHPATTFKDTRNTAMQSGIYGNAVTDRQTALQAIRQARTWFEQVEPSSPVAVLLHRAEKLVGKRFAEVAQCIPLELLERWERE